MNIALLVDSLHSIAAGSERQIYKLAEGLVKAGHDLHLYVLRHTHFTRTLSQFPCPISSLDIDSIASYKAIKRLTELRNHLKDRGTTVVHAYFPDACLLAPLLLKCKRIRVITSRRDMGLIYQGKPAWLYRLLQKRTDKIIANSQAVAAHTRQCEHLSAEKTAVIYNGIEVFSGTAAVDAIFHQPHTTKLILVANIKPVKRTLDAVMAVQQLTLANHEVELALVGEEQDPAYAQQIKDYIQAHNLDKQVHWLGQITEPRRLLHQAHIGLLVSESEGLSNTIMEYMQAGLPIIASRVGGNPELVQHQHNGLLTERGQAQQIATAIADLSSQPQLRETYGINSKARIAQDFSIQALIAQHEAQYQS